MPTILFPQLDGTLTAPVNCGVSATRSAITWATKGLIRPSVQATRRRMKQPTGQTNITHWQRAIESFDTPAELRGRYELLTGRAISAGDWAPVGAHLLEGKAAIVAVDYGAYRRLMPRKAGSTTFDGFHAITFQGVKGDSVMSYDSLLDGRRRGVPKGPVAVPIGKVAQAAEEVGRVELGMTAVWAYLSEPGVKLGEGVDIPEPDAPPTLTSILADLHESLDDADTGPVRKRIQAAIDDLESLIGPYGGEADEDDEPEEGTSPT